jgi:hypothetical protein
MLADVDEIVLPGITHWQSPNFFAFFPANTSGPSILGEHPLERLATRRWVRRQLGTQLAGFGLGEHGQVLDPVEVGGDPVHDRVAVTPERLRGHVEALGHVVTLDGR